MFPVNYIVFNHMLYVYYIVFDIMLSACIRSIVYASIPPPSGEGGIHT